MNQNSTEIKNDVFAVIDENFKKLHTGVEQLIPSCTQSLSNIQQESMKSWKNIVCSNIAMQQMFVEQSGIKIKSTESVAKMIHRTTDDIIQEMQIQNRLTQFVLNISNQNLEIVNKNIETFTKINKTFVEFWQKFWNLEDK